MEVDSERKSKLLKEGGYGCAMSPPLPCAKSKRKLNKKEVGKIIRVKNAKIELTISALVKSIPGWTKFYVIQEKDDCTSKNFQVMRQNYEEDCSIYKHSPDDQLLQLLSPFAGRPLTQFTITNSFDFMGTFRHMFQAVALLNKQGICHYDLHKNNILVDYKGRFRIIDFGAAFLGDEVEENNLHRHVYVFSPDFPPLSPELSIQHGISGGKTIRDSIEETLYKKKVFHDLINMNFYTNIEKQSEIIRKFWREDVNWDGSSWAPFYKKYWRVWDSWALGVLFVDLLYSSFLVPGFKNTWNNNGNLIRKVLKGCLDINPDTRMTAEQAYELIKND